MEIWKDIKNYEGIYQVSNFGNIRSLDRLDNKGRKTKGKSIAIKQAKNNYKIVILYKNGKYKNYLVHRLVAETFVLNPNSYPQVNHKDEDITNNNVNNLEWCTQKYNANYGTRNIRLSKLKDKFKKKVLRINLETNEIKEYQSIKQASRETNINTRSIVECCKRNRKSENGYIWKFKEV